MLNPAVRHAEPPELEGGVTPEGNDEPGASRSRQWGLIFLLLAGCEGDGGDESTAQIAELAASEQPASLRAEPASGQSLLTIQYGQHFPNGQAAMTYLVGPEGTWQEIENPEYLWNFYQNCATSGRPYDRNSLIRAADGTRFFTAPDANCNLLLDSDGDGVIEPRNGARAFFEHRGRGVEGRQYAAPFTNFWFDDNWLARYATDAYGYPSPDGLGGYPEKIRWSILSGQLDAAIFYGDDDFDRLALDGLHYLVAGQREAALAKWQRIRDRSRFFFDPANQRYDYVDIDENYHLALFGVLAAMLLDTAPRRDASYDELVQHWVSIRSNILSRQERQGEALLGWRSSHGNLGSLMNTETIALNVLALGAGALQVFEAGKPPLTSAAHGYLQRPHNVLSAVTGLSQPGYMISGLAQSYVTGEYAVEFFLRSPAAVGDVAMLEVVDAANQEVLVTRTVSGADLRSGNTWSQLTLRARVSGQRTLEFRTYWLGISNLDVAAVRVRRLAM